MRSRIFALAVCLLIVPGAGAVRAHDPSDEGAPPWAGYLANEGVIVVNGKTKVLFDAFFSDSYGQYALVPEKMRAEILAGKGPFQGVDAVFISHAHGDHFTAVPTLAYLRAQPTVHLYAPKQAVDALRLATGPDDPVFARMTAIDLKPGDAPWSLAVDDLVIEAVAIPHAGGARNAGVQNLAFRVTLDGETTAAHFGDAAPIDAEFARQQAHWDGRIANIAFPPYWFLTDRVGRAILRNRIHALKTVGIHVPARAAGNGDEWRRQAGGDLFTDPGKTRAIPSALEE